MSESQPLRILVLTPTVPYPPNWGFGIRVYQFVRQLSQRNKVSLVCYASPGEDEKIAALAKICHSVHTVQNPLHDQREKRKAQFMSLFSRRSFQSGGFHTAEMQRLITLLLESEKFDLIQMESSQLGSYSFGTGSLIALDEHNLEYELLQRMYQTEPSLLRKLYNYVEYRKFRREEIACWHRSDMCILTSTREQAVVRAEVPDKPTHTAPNGVDIDFFQPSDLAVDPNSLVFTGLISYRPNTDAVLFFVKEVLPHILLARPAVVFTIVGMGAPDEVIRLAGPNVVVTGEVPDVRPFVHRASVFVVPLRMGSGTRLKVLEGLAMGKPMVSTSLGCEGIDVRADQDLLIEDEPVAFADAVLRLLKDRELALQLGNSGRDLVENRYSWASIVESMEEFHRRRIENKVTA